MQTPVSMHDSFDPHRQNEESGRGIEGSEGTRRRVDTSLGFKKTLASSFQVDLARTRTNANSVSCFVCCEACAFSVARIGRCQTDPEDGESAKESEGESSDTKTGDKPLPSIQHAETRPRTSSGSPPVDQELVPRTYLEDEHIAKFGGVIPPGAEYLLDSLLCPDVLSIGRHVVAVFMHYLVSISRRDATPLELFKELHSMPDLVSVFGDALSLKEAKRLIDKLIKAKGLFSVACGFCRKKGIYGQADMELVRVRGCK
jgi:hypothetical protein